MQTVKLPLDGEAQKALIALKNQLAQASLHLVDESDFAIAATLNQKGRSEAFYARTLSLTEQKHSAIEKEAYAIVEALRKWRHLLIGKHFNLVTDQKKSFIHV